MSTLQPFPGLRVVPLDHPIYLVLAGVYLLVTSASLAVLLIRRGDRDFDKTRRATWGWWPVIVSFNVALLLGGYFALFFFALLSVLGLREYIRLLPEPPSTPEKVALYLAVPVHYATLIFLQRELFFTGFLGYTFIVVPLVAIAAHQGDRLMIRVGLLQWGLVAIVLGISHCGFLLQLPAAPGTIAQRNSGLFVFVVMLTMLNDAAQFVCGRLFGRHHMVPRLSPKKTWEGLGGGALICALIGALSADSLTTLSPLVGGLSGAAISGVGFLGDLVISAIKRDAGVKDTGRLIPGQGGLLDRCDSLIFTVPLFTHLVVYALG